MRSLLAALFLLGVACVPIAAQNTKADAELAAHVPLAGASRVFFSAPGLVPPEMIPLAEMPPTSGKCHDKVTGAVQVALVVDRGGHARNVYLESALGNELDRLAVTVAGLDRFKPGTLNGTPVETGAILDIRMEGCIDKAKDASGKKISTIHLRSLPQQGLSPAVEPDQPVYLRPEPSLQEKSRIFKVGSGIVAPKPIKFREAEFSDYARQKKIQGVCMLTLTVDEHGLPKDIHVVRSVEPSLDEKAMEAVYDYRFKPAMLNGNPVPVSLSVEVSFRLY